MVALKNERRVFLWRFTPAVVPKEAAKPATLDEILVIVEAEYTAKRARVFISGGGNRLIEDDNEEKDEKNQIYIADISREAASNTITLLINRGDPNAATTAFLDIDNNAVRIEQPKQAEVPGWSAHLVISLSPIAGRYRACFEQMPHVSSALVLSALDKIITRAVDGLPQYTFEKPTKPKKKGEKPGTRLVAYRPVLTLQRVPSERLLDDIKEGELSGVTLTKRKQFYTGVGPAPIITSQEEKIILRTARAEASVVEQWVKTITQMARDQKYESVTFHLDHLAGDRSNTPTIPLSDHDALEHLYARSQNLTGFSTFLEVCYKAINGELQGKIVALLSVPALWAAP